MSANLEYYAIRVPGGYLAYQSPNYTEELSIRSTPRLAMAYKTLDEARAAANGCPAVRVVVMVEECL